jgi:acetyl esterase/lipase
MIPVALLVFPAPSHQLWLAAVAASELSLTLAILGGLGVACGLAASRLGDRSRANRIAIVLSILGSVVLLTPTIAACVFASQHEMPLSVREYFCGTSLPACKTQIDVVYHQVGQTQLMLDVYEPAAPLSNSRPAVIVVHGGSWRNGHKSDFPLWNRWLASAGYVVFDVNYRLANDSTHFPAQLHDVEAAIDWVRQNAAHYGVDRSRLALLGRSAGGQLALLAAYGARGPEANGIKCVISFYAPTDMVWDYEHPAFPDIIHAKEVLINYLGGTPQALSAIYKSASPTEQFDANMANKVPTLLIHGGRDQLVLQQNMFRLASKVERANVPLELVDLPWVNHGFDYSYGGWGGQISRVAMLRFLKRYLECSF